MSLTVGQIIGLLALGLGAGALGGMLGIGGSILMIPVLTLLLNLNHHISQAVAMIVNVFVSLPALWQHHQAKAVRWDVMGKMLPFGIGFILVGVEASNQIDGEKLERMFGAFLLWVIWTNVYELIANQKEPELVEQRTTWTRVGLVGTLTGFMAGLLGIGGGIIAVPLLQRVCRLPLRQCIATTAAMMVITATIGSIRKNYTLSGLVEPGIGPDSWRQSLMIAAVLAPTAVIGGLVGGKLTHVLPLNWVRVAFILLMSWASLNMLGII
ncbi:MAG: sulfite exporter TauE/SafE family protein [Phycisphaerales bacterium]|nr:sulfite exporter TauE/SafE family protein [Phycisphaerales bacterium]